MGVGVGVAVGSELLAGILNYFANKETNKQNLSLANQARADTMAAARQQQKNWSQQFAQNEEVNQWNMGEADKNRAERNYATGYAQEQNAYQRAANLLGQNYDLWARKTAPFTRSA